MQALWKRIETWLASNAPNIMQSLQPGASDEEIAATEAFLGIQFPEDVRAFYRVHNGQAPESPGLLDGWELLSLDQIQFQWQVWKDLLDDGDFAEARSQPNGPIVDDWWHPKWIPLTYDGAGDHHSLDLNPTADGDVGQIIIMWHDDPERPLIARSFRSWIERFADDLENDLYIFSDEYGGLIPKDEL